MNKPQEIPQTLIERAAAWIARTDDDQQQAQADAMAEANSERPEESGYDVDAAGQFTGE